MVGYQAEGSAPFKQGAMVDNPETIATAIRIGHPQSWDLAHEVEKESNGWFDALSDADILSAQKLLTEQEGIFCEPASATSLAGAMRDIKSGKIPKGSTIVCTLTGCSPSSGRKYYLHCPQVNSGNQGHRPILQQSQMPLFFDLADETD
jgi:threonine synthase